MLDWHCCHVWKQKSRMFFFYLVVPNYVLVSPLFGEDEPNLADIFQMGWFNHQPVLFKELPVVSWCPFQWSDWDTKGRWPFGSDFLWLRFLLLLYFCRPKQTHHWVIVATSTHQLMKVEFCLGIFFDLGVLFSWQNLWIITGYLVVQLNLKLALGKRSGKFWSTRAYELQLLMFMVRKISKIAILKEVTMELPFPNHRRLCMTRWS